MRIIGFLTVFVLGIVGGILGWQIGRLYAGLPAVGELSKNWQHFSFAAFIIFGVLIGALVGLYFLRRIIQWVSGLLKLSTSDKIAIVLGIGIGLLFSIISIPILKLIPKVGRIQVNNGLILLVSLIFIFLFVNLLRSMKDDLADFFGFSKAIKEPIEPPEQEKVKLLDTNVIIDGRIYDICKTGFLEGRFYVPRFVLKELQLIADSPNELKRARGRRGLDILNQMKKELKLNVQMYDEELEKIEGETVDMKLVRLAKHIKATIVTNDSNVDRIAKLQGVRTLNVNELATALKPVVLPGEEKLVTIVKEGKEPGQGVAYLEDGTMVVIKNASKYIGETLPVVVTQVLQIASGKMIFADLKTEKEAVVDRDIGGYPSGGTRKKSSI